MKRVDDGVPPEALCETAGIKGIKPEKLKRNGEQVITREEVG